MSDRNPTNIDLKRVARTLWRRKLWVALPALVGLASGLVVAHLTPPTYSARTMVQVEPQKIPSDYVKTTVTTNMSERLKTLEQQVTNRNNLLTLVHQLNLYPDLLDRGLDAQAANRARNALRVGSVKGRIFTVSFESDEPETAADAANRIAELFVTQNLEIRERQAGNASTFLAQELAEVKTALTEQEAQVLTFKQRNRGYLPEDRAGHLNAINIIQRKLDDNRLSRQRLETELQLLAPKMAPFSAEGPRPSQHMTQIVAMRRELAELLTVYTERHPDVIRLRSQIAAREVDLMSSPPDPTPIPQAAVDPILSVQRQTTLQEIATLATERDRLLADLDLRQAALERIPVVEQRLFELSRDYETTRRHHDTLLKKSQDANLAENLEIRQQSEQFNILERAIPPRSPARPDKKKLASLGLLIGAALGAGLAFLRQETDHTFTDPESLQNAFPAVQVMAAIPRIETPTAEPGSQRRRKAG